MRYQWSDGTTVHWVSGWISYRIDGKIPRQWPVPIKTGPYLGAVMVEDPELDTWVYRLFADTTTIPGSLYFDTPSPLPDIGQALMAALGLANEPVVVGLSANAFLSATEDQFFVLVRDTANQFSEASAFIGSSGFTYNGSLYGTNYLLDFLPSYPRRLVYFHDAATMRSFAQWPTPEGWQTRAWWGTTPAERQKLADITHRIEAVIDPSAGGDGATYLLSTEDQIGRVYRYDGAAHSLVAEFPLGTLAFIGEVFIGGTPMLVFSRAVFLPTGNDISFEIRAIRTAAVVSTFPAP
jgi:hypothetical protein